MDLSFKMTETEMKVKEKTSIPTRAANLVRAAGKVKHTLLSKHSFVPAPRLVLSFCVAIQVAVQVVSNVLLPEILGVRNLPGSRVIVTIDTGRGEHQDFEIDYAAAPTPSAATPQAIAGQPAGPDAALFAAMGVITPPDPPASPLPTAAEPPPTKINSEPPPTTTATDEQSPQALVIQANPELTN